MTDLLCPYCSEWFPRGAVMFRCINPDAFRCTPSEDTELARYRRQPEAPRLPPVFQAEPKAPKINGVPRSARCRCGYESSKIICPHCHNELPFEFGQLDGCTIAMIGAKSAGKTNYIGVLIHELETRICAAFGGSISACDDQTMDRYKADYYTPLFRNNRVINETVSARSRIEVRYPLVYRLNLAKRGWVGTTHKIVGLTFFDTAGEDLVKGETTATEAGYIANANGLIMLLDPLQLRAVRDQLAGSVALPPENEHQSEIINVVTRLLRKKAGDKIKTPLAIAFSKVDALRPLLNEPVLLRSGHHQGYVDLDDLDQVHHLLRAYVERWAGHNLVNLVSESFQHWRFFGLSALGAPPTGATLPYGISPFRVEDPVLWLLYMNGIVNGQRAKRSDRGG
jgi:GTPase SAR1 family protein